MDYCDLLNNSYLNSFSVEKFGKLIELCQSDSPKLKYTMTDGGDGEIFKKNYNKNFSFLSLCGRKVTALPLAAWHGIIQPIYRLAIVLLLSIKIIERSEKCFTKQFYHIGREFQMALGYITSIFFDRFGMWHIDKAWLQKWCYDGGYARTMISTYISNLIRKMDIKENQEIQFLAGAINVSYKKEHSENS